MGKKGVHHHNYKNGLRAGYVEYRYGASSERTITLSRPIMNEDRRKHLVNDVVDMLRDWRSSPWEDEGAMRAGLRAGLCLQGHGWLRSDQEAASIVASSFRRLGRDNRPSWDEGQREYVEPRENCAWCGSSVPDELMVGNRRTNFCSSTCARSAMVHRAIGAGEHARQIYHAAAAIIDRTKKKPIKCGHCSRSFRPRFDCTVYCSRECRDAARQRRAEKTCLHCRKAFQVIAANADRSKYCSAECYTEGRKARQIERICVSCGNAFVAGVHKARHCCSACGWVDRRFRKGAPPKRISPLIFDYVLRREGLTITGERMAA